MRAVVQNRDLAAASGIATRRVDPITFFLGSGPGRHRRRRADADRPDRARPRHQLHRRRVPGRRRRRPRPAQGTVIAAFALGLLKSYIEYSTTRQHRKVHRVRRSSWFPPVSAPRACSRSGPGPDMSTTTTTAARRRRACAARSPARLCPRGRGLLLGAGPAGPADATSGSGLLAKYLLLRDRRRRHRPGLGPGRHARPRPGRLLRARRLRHGDAPQARRRRSRQRCPTSWCSTARRRAAGVVGAVPQPGVRAGWRSCCCPTVVAAAARLRSSSGAGSSGAYFAILTQALAAAFVDPADRPAGTTGGINGLTNFQGFFGYSLDDPVTSRWSTSSSPAVLLAADRAARPAVRSRFGELLVATRDAEDRVRFLGYDPATSRSWRTSSRRAWPAWRAPCSSRSSASSRPTRRRRALDRVVVGVARRRPGLAGRRGARRDRGVLGQTTLSEPFPDDWFYFQGALFVLVCCSARRARRSLALAGAGAPPAAAAGPRPPDRRTARNEEVTA